MNFCSNCGTKLSEGSKFCSTCGKEILGIDQIFDQNIPPIDKKNNNIPTFNRIRVKKQISGWVWIIVIIWVIYGIFTGNWIPWEKQINATNNGSSEINSTNTNFKPVTISNDDQSSIKLVYDSKNRQYQFKDGDNILGYIDHIDKADFKEKFVNKLNNGNVIPLKYDATIDNEKGGGKDIGIIIDNSYSFSKDGVLNKNLPAINLSNALNLLGQENINNQTYKIGFVFSSGSGSEPIINMEYFTLTIDKLSFERAIILKKDKNSEGKEVNINWSDSVGKGGTLNMKNGSFEVIYLKDSEKVSLDECIGSERTFQCPSNAALVNKLKNISTKYTNYSGFYLLDYLNIANGSVFYSLDGIYIFSDGEFQLQPSTSRDLLKNLNANTAGIRNNKADFPYNKKAQQYPTPQMNEVTFNNNRTWIADYRKNAAKILNKNFVHCQEGKPNITFIGLNPEPTFNPFMTTVYEQIFEDCETHFNS